MCSMRLLDALGQDLGTHRHQVAMLYIMNDPHIALRGSIAMKLLLTIWPDLMMSMSMLFARQHNSLSTC